MKKTDRILAKIANNKEMSKSIKDQSFSDEHDFINNANAYIKAIKEGRVICSIDSVSRSGMSRTIKFLSCEKGGNTVKHYYRNYFVFFKIMGFSPANSNSHYFRIGGCGMDMIFHTNYTIIHKLRNLGFISKKECNLLAQMTPSII